MLLPVVEVAACIVRSNDGKVLLAERTARQVAAGYWEIPGGKIDPGETPPQAAARELFEEIGIRAQSLGRSIAYEHRFPTKRVRLNFFVVDDWTGTPHGREGQRLAWVDPAAPSVGPILSSNERMLWALGLPPLYVATVAADSAAREDFLRRLPTALAGGVRLIHVCEPDLAPDQRVAFAKRICALAAPFGALVMMADSVPEARRADAAGVHSSAQHLRRCTERPPVRLWAASCHDGDDLAHAIALGADFAVLSPVPSWSAFQALASAAPIPIYATGGTSISFLSEARRAGAVGIAVVASEVEANDALPTDLAARPRTARTRERRTSTRA